MLNEKTDFFRHITNDVSAPHLRDDIGYVLKGLFDWILGHIPLKTYNVCDQINCVEIIIYYKYLFTVT